MLQIGITGGMGTGKSTVCKIFQSLGVPVLNTDELTKQLYLSNAFLQQKIKDAVAIHGALSHKTLIDNLPKSISYGEIKMVLAAEKT